MRTVTFNESEFKLVPVEPTDEMEAAAVGDYEQSGGTYRKSAYAAMLAAAPTPPASAQDDAKDERQAFEAWAGNKGWTLSPDQNNCGIVVAERYGHRAVQTAWEAWQARASVAAPAAGDARAFNIEAAAKAMAECMDYPWAHMPEQGRATMREHAQTVIRAASQQQEG